jgi:hypothetical protein
MTTFPKWHQPDLVTPISNGAARERTLGLGRAIEVLEPEPLRRSAIDLAEQIVDLCRQ